MHQILFSVGAPPHTPLGLVQCCLSAPDPLAGVKGSTSKGRVGGERRERKGMEKERRKSGVLLPTFEYI